MINRIIENARTYPETFLQVPYPANCNLEMRKYFDETREGTVRACSVLELEQVYANRELILWKDRQMLPEGFAHPWLKDSLYGSFKNKSVFIVKNLLRRTQLVQDPVLWCIDAYTTGGYYHWITEVLPRLWMVREYLPRLRFALPDYFLKRWSFVGEFLELLGIKQLLVINNCTKYRIRHLVLPTRTGDPFYRQHEPIAEAVKWLQGIVSECADRSLGERLYISREKARYRKVINEKELIPVLEKYHFKVIHLEEYSLADQISICSRAKVLLGLHGAGLSNMVFLPPDGKLIEIRPEKIYYMYNCFHTLAAHCEAAYNVIFCDYASEPLPEDRRLDDHSVWVDPAELEEQLGILLAG